MKTKKASKVLLFTGMGIVALVLIYVGGTIWLEGYVRRQLEEKVASSSGGIYALSIQEVSLSPIAGSLTIHKASLRTDTLQYKQANGKDSLPMATVSVYQLKVRQVKWLHYLLNKQLEVGSITLTRPQVTLERFPEASQSSPNKKSQPQKSVLESLPEKLSPIATSLAIKELTIENLSFRDWQHAQKGVIEQKADSVGFSLHNIHFDDTTRSALYADSFFFTVKHYAYLTPDSLYQLAVSMARLDSKSKSLSLKNVSYQPIVKDEEYKRRRTYQHDRYKVGIDQIKATGIDFYALFHQKKLLARELSLTNANVNLFRDRNQPKQPGQKGFMPNDFFRKLPLYVSLQKVTLADVDFTYSELPKNASQPAMLRFLNSSATATNLTNDPEQMSPKHPASLTLQSWLYGSSKMELRLQVPLLQKELQGHMEGSLMETKAPVFNQVLAPYTRFAIKAGYIDKIEFQADIVNSTAKGTLSSEYKDLSIEVTTKGGKKSKLLSLLGNLVIENDNKQGKSEASQTVSIQHVHQQENNMVNFVWGTLRDGLLKTIKPEIVE